MSSTPIKEDSLVEHNSTMGSTEGNSLPSNVPAYDSHTEKKLLRKVDYRLVPILAALYSISVIDRVNIANARVAGMDVDLQLMVGNRYTVAVLVFFIPYILLELPSNIALRKVGTANWLGFIAFSWGCVMIGQGFVHSHQALTVCRALLGIFEAGFFPACVYLISCWYARFEVHRRLAMFYVLSMFGGGFANILAYGLMQMEGLGGLRGWRWIFIIEGLLTVIVAVLAWLFVIDFPDKAQNFLTDEQAAFIQHRIQADRGDAVPDALTWKKALDHLKDFKLWVFATMLTSTTMPAYAFAYFTPVIVVGMGYTAGIANLLSAPPLLFAVPCTYAFSWIADKYRVRAPVIVAQALIVLIGLMLTAYHNNNGVRYFGLFLGLAGCQGNIPAIIAYQSNNIRLQSKRSVGSATQIGFGGIGGILASVAFKQAEAPTYRTGLWATAALQFYIIGCCAVMSFYFRKKNLQADNGTLGKPIEGQEGFKYTL